MCTIRVTEENRCMQDTRLLNKWITLLLCSLECLSLYEVGSIITVLIMMMISQSFITYNVRIYIIFHFTLGTPCEIGHYPPIDDEETGIFNHKDIPGTNVSGHPICCINSHSFVRSRDPGPWT